MKGHEASSFRLFEYLEGSAFVSALSPLGLPDNKSSISTIFRAGMGVSAQAMSSIDHNHVYNFYSFILHYAYIIFYRGL